MKIAARCRLQKLHPQSEIAKLLSGNANSGEQLSLAAGYFSVYYETMTPNELTPTQRMTMNKKQLNYLIEDIQANGIKDTIKYVEHNGENFVVDGHHRLIAANRLKMMGVPVEKVELPYLGYKSLDDLLWLE